MDGSSAPSSVAQDAFLKLQWAFLGLVFWEHLTHMDHDWRLARNAPPWRWPLTTWAYLLSRYSMFLTIILSVSGVGAIPCNTAVRLFFAFPYLFFVSSTYLIVARTVAIWARALWVVVVSCVGMTAQVAVAIYALAIFRADYQLLPGSTTSQCVPVELRSVQSTASTNTGVDMIILAIMFTGLWRRPETRARGRAGLVRVLWAQGLTLLAIVFIAGIPLIVLIAVNINVVGLTIAITASFILQGLGATRMARNLYEDPTLTPIPNDPNASSSSEQLELSTVDAPVSYLDLACTGNKAASSSSVV
ncbi:unnamed protein product [Peniophora sp. CBMAI 1063]|nr:unnamed protein product [Peniophora sp. CBMAI 1063]